MRSLYNALIEKTVGYVPDYTEFLSNDGHSAFYAKKAPYDKTLLETLGKYSVNTEAFIEKQALEIREMREDRIARHGFDKLGGETEQDIAPVY